MSARTGQGGLTIEALESGMKEQYAVLRRRGKVVIELEIADDGRRFLVSETVTGGIESTWKGETFDFLSEARAEFERLVRKNP